ncbi:MAG: hypothetical protein J7K80_02300 [Candidatus Izimaplasma sp.]|nr:hypothetical protein [Candidatus Izimaplasma bacterium]
MGKDYKLNNVVVFVNGVQIIKGIIDEKIIHQTQKGKIVKYFIRPYGRADFVEIAPENIYDSFEQARAFVISAFEKSFSKEILKNRYNEAIKIIKEKHNAEMKTFNKDRKTVLDSINLITDDFCNKLENAYQKQIKKQKDDEIGNCNQIKKEKL